MSPINILPIQLTAGLVLVFFQNWLKQSKWFSLITYETTRANHLFAIALAVLATVGIHFTWVASAGSLTITGLNWSAMAAAFWPYLQQYIVTKTAYVALRSNLNPATAQVPSAVVVMPSKETANAPSK